MTDLIADEAVKARRADPLNPDGAAMRKLERVATGFIYAALQKWGKALFRGVTSDTVSLLTTRLDTPEFNKPLRDALIETLMRVADAGVDHGRKQVDHALTARKALDPSFLEFVMGLGSVDWTSANTDAAQWAIEYGYSLVRGITETTRKHIATEIRYFVDNSITIGQLRDRLMAGSLFSKQRATAIAVTEVTRAYAEGNTAAWKASKVVEGREWQTAVDSRVCPLCGPLHGKVAKMGEPFGIVMNPPRHVACRCWVLPVVIGDDERFAGLDELLGR
jgi:SPP1 gp7 family putative phage head morphogenesis protein